MQKIMFDDNFHLTRAVQEGWKNMTRRIAKSEKPRYKVGEIVAVAQSYKDALGFDGSEYWQRHSAGWDNKMFVNAYLMPTRIRITAWRRERMQEISDEDCLKEGIYKQEPRSGVPALYAFETCTDQYGSTLAKRWYASSREAFAALIDKVSGRGTWDDNPYVDVYEFELVK